MKKTIFLLLFLISTFTVTAQFGNPTGPPPCDVTLVSGLVDNPSIDLGTAYTTTWSFDSSNYVVTVMDISPLVLDSTTPGVVTITAPATIPAGDNPYVFMFNCQTQISGTFTVTGPPTTAIPDANFEQALIDAGIDKDGSNGSVLTASISGVTSLNLSGLEDKISDLTGIADFVALTSLNCSNNLLTSLDVSANTALTSLNCGFNKLTSLNVSANTALTDLVCVANQLKILDVRANTALITLHCFWMVELTCISVNDTTNIPSGWSKQGGASYNLDCSPTTAIPDANFEQALIDVGLDSGAIDGSVFTVNISDVTSLNLNGKNITDLTGIADFVALTSLYCSVNQLTSLDVSANSALENLGCVDNLITSLDVSTNTALTDLDCKDNLITSLDVSKNTVLKYLFCSGNAMTSLDLSTNTSLTSLYAGNNKLLTSLNVKNGANISLVELNAVGNSALECILVDSAQSSVTKQGWSKDATASYNEVTCIPEKPFITVWKTTTNSESITIPTHGNYTYNYTVNWGDGTIDENQTGNATHEYSMAGSYDVEISGKFPAIYFDETALEDKRKITDISQWGDIEWESFNSAFSYCQNLNSTATDVPNLAAVNNTYNMFFGASAFNGDISEWDVSSVTSMSNMFNSALAFNQDISEWDVSSVVDMSYMFYGAVAFNQPLNWGEKTANVTNMSGMFAGFDSYQTLITVFNQDISGWDVSNVTSMEGMFSENQAFDQDLSVWDVSSVTNMRSMFYKASSFNQDLSVWDVRNVTNMSAMFSFATSFDQPLNWGEKTANVTDMSSMFSNATQMRRREHKVSAIKTAEPVSLGFNQDISDWNVSSVINMSSMFAATTAFNQDLSAWDVSSVTTMSNMFSNASAFNQPLNWGIKTANVTNMYAMFSQYVDQGGSVGVELQAKAAKAEPGSLGFNQDISSWDVSRVTNMYSMFASTAAFNQDLSAWNVSGVANMSSMFSNATAFNQPLNWATKTENVESMNNMFDGASAFNQDISGWFVDSVYSMENMLDNSGFSSENYDKLLTAYSAGILKDNVTLGAAGITYCNGAAGRTTLEGKGWNFVDGGIDCPPMLESTTPANNAIDVALDAVLVLTFDDYISVASGNIQINRKDKSLPALVIDITSSTLISTDSRAVKVKLGALTESLAYNTEYFITMDNEAVKGSGSKFFGGISSITTFSFTTVNKPLPTIVFEAIDATYGDAVITLNAISNSQGAISYSIVGDANEASISGDQLTIGNAGEITIKATVAEGQAHLGSSKEVTVTVAKANQTITFKAIDATYGDGAITLNATSDSQGAISYSIVGDANGASIDGNQLTLGNAGEITIKATVVTSLNHLGGSEEVTVTIAKASQTITFNVLKLDGSDIINLKGTASSGLPVTFTSSDVSVASIMGIEMTLLKIGLTTITAYQSGNDNYIAAESVEQELNIKYLAIGDYDTTGPVVSLYPNPAVNFIKIDLESSADINVKIFSVLGDLVLEKQNYVSKESISLSGLIEGVYFVKITVDNKQITKKIIKK